MWIKEEGTGGVMEDMLHGAKSLLSSLRPGVPVSQKRFSDRSLVFHSEVPVVDCDYKSTSRSLADQQTKH